jgi:hypothetical protein
MAYTGIFATELEVKYKAGHGASATATAEAYLNSFMFQAESHINSMIRFNFSDVYSTLNADVKGILNDAASNLAAIYVINYDMSGYTSRTEAENMVNILRDSALRSLSTLRNRKVQTFINEA